MLRFVKLTMTMAALAMLVACGSDDDDGGPAMPPPPGPDLIVFEMQGLVPEGIEYDAVRNRFIVGSITQGTIHAVSDDGEISVVVGDSGLDGNVGIHIDTVRDQLLAAARLGPSGPIGLGYYDLETGETIRVVDFGIGSSTMPALANDVVVDAAGNAYVTETNGGAVYVVDTEGNVEVLLDVPELSLANGIEIYQDEYLLVATIGPAPIVRIPIADPQAFTLLEADTNQSGDGIVLMPDGDLVMVTIAGDARVVRLRTDDWWETATVVGTWDGFDVEESSPTTAAVRGDDVHVVFAHLGDETRTEYEIARVDFGSE